MSSIQKEAAWPWRSRLITAFALGGAADLLATLLFLRVGVGEINPLATGVIEVHGDPGLVLFKAGGIALAVAICLWARRTYPHRVRLINTAILLAACSQWAAAAAGIGAIALQFWLYGPAILQFWYRGHV
jgi:hypothetical protein